MDSILFLSGRDLHDPGILKSFYDFALRYLFSEELFKSNDATLVQLRNSGGYRPIHRDHVADSITLYDTRVHLLYEQGDYYLEYYKQIRELLDKMADLNISGQEKHLPELAADPHKTRLFFNKIREFRIAVYSYCNSLQYLKGHLICATRVIKFLKKNL